MPSIYRKKGDEQNTGTMNVLAPSASQTPQDQQGQQAQASGESSSIGSTGQATGQKAPPTQSGQFQNLKAYLNAGKNVGQNLSKNIATNVGQQATDAASAVQAKKAEYENTLRANQATAQQNYQQASNALTGQAPTVNADQFKEYVQGSNIDQTKLAEQQAAFQNQQAEAANVQADLAAKAEAAKTEQGRQNLLQEAFGKKGRYSTGMSKLDQLLLQGSGQQNQVAQDVAKQAADLKAKQEALTAELTPQEQAYQAELNKLQGTGEGTISGLAQKQYADLDTLLKKRMADYQAGEKGLETGIENYLLNQNADLNALNLTDADKATLKSMKEQGVGGQAMDEAQFTGYLTKAGIDPETAKQMYADNEYRRQAILDKIQSGLNLSSTSDAARFINAQDRARYEALQKLTGAAGLAGTSDVFGSDLQQAALTPGQYSASQLGVGNNLLQAPITQMDSAYMKSVAPKSIDLVKKLGIDPNGESGRLMTNIAMGTGTVSGDQMSNIMGNAVDPGRGVTKETRDSLANAINSGDSNAFNAASIDLFSQGTGASPDIIQAYLRNPQEAAQLALVKSGLKPQKDGTYAVGIGQDTDTGKPLYRYLTPQEMGQKLIDDSIGSRANEYKMVINRGQQLINQRRQNKRLADFLQGKITGSNLVEG